MRNEEIRDTVKFVASIPVIALGFLFLSVIMIIAGIVVSPVLAIIYVFPSAGESFAVVVKTTQQEMAHKMMRAVIRKAA